MINLYFVHIHQQDQYFSSSQTTLNNDRNDPTSFLSFYGPHTVSESLQNLPPWLQEYVQWHSKQRKDERLTYAQKMKQKYLVLECREGYKWGGLSDRMRPLPYILLLGHLTDRILLIKWTKPHDLTEFLRPPRGGLDWTSSHELDLLLKRWWLTWLKAVPHQIQYGCTNPIYFPEMSMRDAFDGCIENIRASSKQFFFVESTRNPSSVNELNQFFLEYSRFDYLKRKNEYGQSKHIEDDISALSGYDYIDAFGDIFRVLFEPVPSLARSINITMNKLGLIETKYLSAHIRARYPTRFMRNHVEYSQLVDKEGGLDFYGNKAMKTHLIELSSKAIECAYGTYQSTLPSNTSIKQEYPIFLSTDNHDLSAYMIKHFEHSNIVTIIRNTEPLHLDSDYIGKTTPSDFFPLFEDLLIIGGSRCVVYGHGGFGPMGAGLINNKCRGTYLIKNQLVSCPNNAMDRNVIPFHALSDILTQK